MLEMPRSSAPAIREVLGPLAFKDLKVMVRYRDLEEGFTLWPVPPPIDFEPQARQTTTYQTTNNKSLSDPEPYQPGVYDSSPPSGSIGGSITSAQKPNPVVDEQARPKGLDYKGVKLDSQQPSIGDEEDLMGGVKVTRVTRKPKA